MNNMPWQDIYRTDRVMRMYSEYGGDGGPADVVLGPARPVGLHPDLFAPWGEAVGAPKPKRKDRRKPKTTKNKRRMKKASRKKNRKRK